MGGGGGCGGSIHVSVLFCRRHKSKTKEWHAEEDKELTGEDFSVIQVYNKAERGGPSVCSLSVTAVVRRDWQCTCLRVVLKETQSKRTERQTEEEDRTG